MTRINFYFNVPEQLNFSCRLIRKVFYDSKANREEPIVVFCSKTSKLHLFDELLYSFSFVDFLPHVYAESPLKSDSPIILTSKPWLPDFPRRPNLLLNLDNEVCDSFASFDRVVEVVEKSENTKLAARKKFVFYKNRGYEILNHDVSDK